MRVEEQRVHAPRERFPYTKALVALHDTVNMAHTTTVQVFVLRNRWQLAIVLSLDVLNVLRVLVLNVAHPQRGNSN